MVVDFFYTYLVLGKTYDDENIIFHEIEEVTKHEYNIIYKITEVKIVAISCSDFSSSSWEESTSDDVLIDCAADVPKFDFHVAMILWEVNFDGLFYVSYAHIWTVTFNFISHSTNYFLGKN